MITTEEFLALVKEKLASKTPFAFTRYSDGEIMMLNREEYYNEYLRIIDKLWGYKPNEIELFELSNYLIESLQKSDVIGFPTARHLARTDFFGKAIEVFNVHVGSQYLGGKSILASIDVCYEVLYQDKYDELLRDQDTVNIITCRALVQPLKDKYNIKNVNAFILAPEAKFTSGYVGERHYPNQFNKIKEWIKKIDCRGNLCLVGGGAPSKIYNIWFKEHGGISLDFGAVADLWAGFRTRGAGRGMDAEDKVYKI